MPDCAGENGLYSANKATIQIAFTCVYVCSLWHAAVTSFPKNNASGMKRQRTIPTNLFDLSNPGKMISIQECSLAFTDEPTTPESLSTSSKISLDSNDTSTSSNSNSSSNSGNETGTGSTEDHPPMHQQCPSPRPARWSLTKPSISVTASKLPQTERKNGLVLFSPTTPPSPMLDQDKLPAGSYEEIKEHALRLVQLLPSRHATELPVFLKNHEQLDALVTGLLSLVNPDATDHKVRKHFSTTIQE